MHQIGNDMEMTDLRDIKERTEQQNIDNMPTNDRSNVRSRQNMKHQVIIQFYNNDNLINSLIEYQNI